MLLSLYSKFIKFWSFWRFLLPLSWPNLGQYRFSCLYMAKNWMSIYFYPREIFFKCKRTNLQSNECPFVEIYEIWAENEILSWFQKLENEDFLCFFGQMLAKMVFWCWPMLKNCQKWYLGASSYQELCQELVLAKIWPKNLEFPVKQLFLPTW